MAVQQNTHFKFDFSEAKRKELIYDGDAHFPDKANFLRLTRTDGDENPHPNSMGRVLYHKAVNFWMGGAQAKIDTTVRFIVRRNENNSLHGEGLVFFIVPEGYVFPQFTHAGNLGVFHPSGQSPTLFAVEFDTFSNQGWDPPYMHVGIDIGSRSSAKFNQIPTKFIGEEVTLTIQYDPASGVITVNVKQDAEIIPVSHVFNLSNILPSRVNVGLAASTGDIANIFDVTYWEFRSTLVGA